jgi:YesN/AraC family two-component response regulator
MQSLDSIRFIANQITVQDAMKETLRWLELSYQASMKNHSGNNTNTNHTIDDCDMTPSSSSSPITTTTMKYHSSQSSKWMGYPTRDVSAEDIYRIIASECESYDDEIYMTSNNNNNGVSLQDLADCFDYNISYIATLVQELQNSGQIYQNENGLYTLL